MKISVIGGGITGLTTALALRQVGLNATVYEQSESLNEIGAGIWLQPNAMRVLRWLGLDEEVKHVGCELDRMEITYTDLTPIKKIESEVVSDPMGNRTVAIHRGKLQRILYERCSRVGDIELGANYSGHASVDGGIRIDVGGKMVFSDVLLGADGIRSRVRNTMGLPSEFRRTGQICIRGIAQIDLPRHLQHKGREAWGSKRRFGFSQLSRDAVYFFIVMNKEVSPPEITVDALLSVFKDFDPVISDIIRSSGDVHTTELMDLRRLKTWHDDSACLLGDAAHATTPNMGQGACQGIEDAFYISRALKNANDPVQAFRAFEAQRRKKVDHVVNNSWNFGKWAHKTVGQWTLKTMMKMTPASMMSKQMDRLYAVDGL
jgi:2-polyprenyl-6-methoxyphenol hydroxylase-like FAD-dependent oxidoreductase